MNALVAIADSLRRHVHRAASLSACLLALSGGLLPATCGAAETPVPREPSILAHDLTVEIEPARHWLRATDTVSLAMPASPTDAISFMLHASLRVASIRARQEGVEQTLEWTTQPAGASAGEPRADAQVVAVRLPPDLRSSRSLLIEWRYEGPIHDPPREPRRLRFVTPSETGGHIGDEGVYVSGETGWYPDRSGSLATYRLSVTVPDGWEPVTQGVQLERRVVRAGGDARVLTRWDSDAPSEALTLVANRFVVAQRAWPSASGRPVLVQTYLFPDDAGLADEYLDASVRYLTTYETLLGPYPFPKFAVVENFFASGLGMPSFTLLGSGVIKRHYVQPYALGHEVVHSWIGNWVFNDERSGNWVEGLTTYLANYYHEELHGTPEQAREQRRLMLLGYAVYVRPEEDYAVGSFRRKTDQRDNAVGYQKAAMVFHMLRREIGEAAFWKGLKELVARYGGRPAGWEEVERVFAQAGGRDVRWFFAQWVERPGAPAVSVAEAAVRRGEQGDAHIALRLAQTSSAAGPGQGRESPDAYRLRVPVTVWFEDGGQRTVEVELAASEATARIPAPARPVRLLIDGGFDVFRRVDRAQAPPMLNLFVTDRNRWVVLPDEGAAQEAEPFRQVAARLAGPDSSGTPQAVTTVSGDRVAVGTIPGSVLILGGPGINHSAAAVPSLCRQRVSPGTDEFTVDGRRFQGAEYALLVSCRPVEGEDRTVTLFYGLSSRSASKVARLLFFYGWQSYVVFRDGTVVARGDFEPASSPLEVIFNER
jgi:hypothetical protein